MSDGLVTLEELAEQLGIDGNPAEYVTGRGFEVLTDWSGAAAVSMATAAALAELAPLVLEVDGERVVIDEDLLDFSDLSATEIQTISRMAERGALFDKGEPTPLGVAAFIFVKLSRDRDWTGDHFEAVAALLVAWLTDSLEAVA